MKWASLYNANGALAGITYFTDYDADNSLIASYTEMTDWYRNIEEGYLYEKT